MVRIKEYVRRLATSDTKYVDRVFFEEMINRIDARMGEATTRLGEMTTSFGTLAQDSAAHSNRFENQLNDMLTLTRYVEERTRTHEAQINEVLATLRATEERVQTLERQLADSLTLLHTTEQRSRTLQYQGSQALAESSYQIDMQRKWYIESMPSILQLNQLPEVSKVKTIAIETEHPIALTSNDHLEPDSTTEGLVRPTQFVRHCIDVLGADIRCLELGAGAAGLLFEYIQNGLVAIGIDGSDYCKKNRIGYWPLIPENLYTCDLTHPFRLYEVGSFNTVKFQLITAWEVFEHIAETDLSQTIRNVAAHLEPDGYFLGSISRIAYNDKDGKPYHVTLQSLDWWKQKFEENGLSIVDDHPFKLRLFCRGNGPRFQDFHNYFDNPDDGFHFVARHASIINFPA